METMVVPCGQDGACTSHGVEAPRIELDALRAETVTLRVELTSRVREVQELQIVMAGSRAELTAQKVAYVRMHKTVTEHERRIATLRNDIAGLNTALATADQELIERDRLIESMRHEIHSLSEAFASTLEIGSAIRHLFESILIFFKENNIILADRARDAGQWTLAARYYQRALDRNPNRPDIWLQYGHALKEAGNLSLAEQAYVRAMAGAPENR